MELSGKACGTQWGYAWHYRRNEKVCDICKSVRNKTRKKYKNKYNGTVQIPYQIAYRKSNKEKVAAYQKEWRIKNASHVRDYNRKQRALKKQANHIFYTEQNVLDAFGNLCHLCGIVIDLHAPRSKRMGENWEHGLHIDHVIPLSKGGADNLDNVRPSHAKCNLLKNDKIMKEGKNGSN